LECLVREKGRKSKSAWEAGADSGGSSVSALAGRNQSMARLPVLGEFAFESRSDSAQSHSKFQVPARFDAGFPFARRRRLFLVLGSFFSVREEWSPVAQPECLFSKSA
jgi:hypothetical protein